MVGKYIHQPVLKEEVLFWLGPDSVSNKNEVKTDNNLEFLLVDATSGEGGHAEYFLCRFPYIKLICLDADKDQLALAQERLEIFRERVEFFHTRFSDFFANYFNFSQQRPDRVLFDLGISLRQYEESGRGFSFKKEEPLDMRLNQKQALTAAEIVNTWPESELKKIISFYGEERLAQRIAFAICKYREQKPLESSLQLAKLIEKTVGFYYRQQKIHPATRTFQALRIVVNNELAELEKGLNLSFSTLKLKGRLGVISFHSLEDRIVKNFFKAKNKGCNCPPDLPICQCEAKKELNILTRKPLTASHAERVLNPHARSAKFRVGEKCA